METPIKNIKKQIVKVLNTLESIDNSIIELDLCNEQFVLDFYDKLNEISVRR